MAAKRRFDIGDEVALRGAVRLLDLGGPGTVTVEIAATGQRMTVMADSKRAQEIGRLYGWPISRGQPRDHSPPSLGQDSLPGRKGD
jgi:hypothetical protein